MVLRGLPEAHFLMRLFVAAPSKTTRGESNVRMCPRDVFVRLVLSRSRNSFSSGQHFQQCECILRRCAFGVIVEVNMHVAIFVEPTAYAGRPFSQ